MLSDLMFSWWTNEGEESLSASRRSGRRRAKKVHPDHVSSVDRSSGRRSATLSPGLSSSSPQLHSSDPGPLPNVPRFVLRSLYDPEEISSFLDAFTQFAIYGTRKFYRIDSSG